MKRQVHPQRPPRAGKTREKTLSASLPINRRKEWRFELPLAAIVEGHLPQGRNFKETTILKNISSGGAYFCLDSGVIVGSKLNVILELPERLTEGKKVKLCLGGITVRLEASDKKSKKQGVAVRFNKSFAFVSHAGRRLK
jgi:c-di-GMP-binding flagellar brake protein YcgR